MQNTVVILGSGGTIAGTAASAHDNVGYTAAQLGVDALVAAVPALAGQPIEAEQLAQIDSKDMTFDVWQRLAVRAQALLARADVAGIVVTHGTDTLEETAYFLQRVLAPAKPLVLTAAMRPATALQADGPQNLLDAMTLAREPGARGVLAVLAGSVYGAADVRKQHSWRLDAFDGGDAGPVALLREGRVVPLRAWPAGEPLGLGCIARDPAAWPRVDVLASYAGVRPPAPEVLRALDGIVVAGTGNGTVHAALEQALREAEAAGVRVLRSTRCAAGGVVGEAGVLPSAGPLTPWQARVELLLRLLAERAA